MRKMLLRISPVSLLFLSMLTAAQDGISPLADSRLDSPYIHGSVRGQLRPSYYTIISAGISAKLLSFPVLVGQRVETGQQVAMFDCSVQNASVAVAAGRLDAAQQRSAVNKRLQELGNIGALELALAEAEAVMAAAELRKERAIMAECVVLAPFSGTVTEKFVQAHQYTNRGDQLFELIDTRNLEVEMVVSSMLLRSYRPGALFSIHIDETDQVVNARLNRIVGVVDPVSQTVKFIGEILGDSEGLLPGMSGTVTFSNASQTGR